MRLNKCREISPLALHVGYKAEFQLNDNPWNACSLTHYFNSLSIGGREERTMKCGSNITVTIQTLGLLNALSHQGIKQTATQPLHHPGQVRPTFKSLLKCGPVSAPSLYNVMLTWPQCRSLHHLHPHRLMHVSAEVCDMYWTNVFPNVLQVITLRLTSATLSRHYKLTFIVSMLNTY